VILHFLGWGSSQRLGFVHCEQVLCHLF
jgi:hypothetical protein